jgi:hypothetical protein
MDTVQIVQSSGAISSLNYAATSNHVPMIPYIVSLSSRFHMADVKRKHGPELMELLGKQVLSEQLSVESWSNVHDSSTVH